MSYNEVNNKTESSQAINNDEIIIITRHQPKMNNGISQELEKREKEGTRNRSTRVSIYINIIYIYIYIYKERERYTEKGSVNII